VREHAIVEGDCDPCGSEPARDNGVSVNRNVECQTVIASRLAPTSYRGEFSASACLRWMTNHANDDGTTRENAGLGRCLRTVDRLLHRWPRWSSPSRMESSFPALPAQRRSVRRAVLRDAVWGTSR